VKFVTGREGGGEVLVELVKEFYCIFSAGDSPRIGSIIKDSMEVAASHCYMVVVSEI